MSSSPTSRSWCSPDQVEFYLVDFKKGVEFKCYATQRLPHARVVAIESDREFGLSVLQRVDDELKRRGDLFRQLGVQDLAGYKRAGGTSRCRARCCSSTSSRSSSSKTTASRRTASLLLDRIVRQGRAFGIHVILGSQTLGGAYTLARTTLGQMVIRIALQCNEADAHLIMDDNNPAPRLLSRPGEGIYNDRPARSKATARSRSSGCRTTSATRVSTRSAARARQARQRTRSPIVFEGNAPADVRDNPELATRSHSQPSARTPAARAWLGAPNSIKGPTEAVFHRQSGSHLLLVGQRDERSLLAPRHLAACPRRAVSRRHGARSSCSTSTRPDPASRISRRSSPRHCRTRSRVGRPGELRELMAELGRRTHRRSADAGRDAPARFSCSSTACSASRSSGRRMTSNFRSMTTTRRGQPGQVLADLLGEGGACGMHVIASCDTWNNVSRWLSRES